MDRFLYALVGTILLDHATSRGEEGDCESWTCDVAESSAASVLMQQHQYHEKIQNVMVNEGTEAVAPTPRSIAQGKKESQNLSLPTALHRLATKQAPVVRKSSVLSNMAHRVHLNEDGYRIVAQLTSDEEMEIFTRRVIEAYDCEVLDDVEFRSIVPWFSGTKRTQSFEKLQETILFAIVSNKAKTWLMYKNSAGITGGTALLNPVGYVEIAAMRNPEAMEVFVKRLCEKLHVKIVDEGRFRKMLRLFSHTGSFQDFQNLEEAVLSASHAHNSWAVFTDERRPSGSLSEKAA